MLQLAMRSWRFVKRSCVDKYKWHLGDRAVPVCWPVGGAGGARLRSGFKGRDVFADSRRVRGEGWGQTSSRSSSCQQQPPAGLPGGAVPGTQQVSGAYNASPGGRQKFRPPAGSIWTCPGAAGPGHWAEVQHKNRTRAHGSSSAREVLFAKKLNCSWRHRGPGFQVPRTWGLILAFSASQQHLPGKSEGRALARARRAPVGKSDGLVQTVVDSHVNH